MTDANLLIFGCGVSFIVIAGVYVFFGERIENPPRKRVASVDSLPRTPIDARGGS